jgi:parallel beta-helix repeat protein
VIDGKKVYYLLNEVNLDINPSTYPDVGFLALVNCINITVQNLDLKNSGQGIILAYTTGSTVAENYFSNSYNGIILYSSSSTLVFGNEITNNVRGIQLSLYSSTNTIASNNITNNGDGIFLFNSTTNSIAQNNITNNNIGIGFRSSSNNLIRGNYFISNTRQVFDNSMEDSSITASANIWSFGYPAGGNYWSDYTGIDMQSGANQDLPDGDGLGDTPYIVYGSNIDEYPLLPFGSPPGITLVSPENKTYTVTSVSLMFDVNVPTSQTAYSLDGQTQVEITGDITLEDLAIGSHYVTVYVTDQDGLENSVTVYFTVTEGAEPPQSEFPLTYLAVIVVVIVVAAVIVFYFMRIRKKKNYSGINMQQGSVQMDSDSNE